MNTTDAELEKFPLLISDEVVVFLLENNVESLELKDFNRVCDRLFKPIFTLYDQRLSNLAAVLIENFFIKGTTVSCEKTSFNLFLNENSIDPSSKLEHQPLKFNNISPKIYSQDIKVFLAPAIIKHLSMAWNDKLSKASDSISSIKTIARVLCDIMHHIIECCRYMFIFLQDINRIFNFNIHDLLSLRLVDHFEKEIDLFPNAHKVFDKRRLSRRADARVRMIDYIGGQLMIDTSQFIRFLSASLNSFMTFSGKCKLTFRYYIPKEEERLDYLYNSFILKHYVLETLSREFYPMIERGGVNNYSSFEKIRELAAQQPPQLREIFKVLTEISILYDTNKSVTYGMNDICEKITQATYLNANKVVRAMNQHVFSNKELVSKALPFLRDQYANTNLGLLWLMDTALCPYLLVAKTEDSLAFIRNSVQNIKIEAIDIIIMSN